MLTGGYAHPWPGAADLATLTTVLHAAAGQDADLPEIPDGADFVVPDSRREHEEQLRALHRQLAEAASRDEWYERQLSRKEKELKKARAQIAAFSGSVGFRVVKLGYRLARKARNHLHKGQR